jgi:hypothetical protein
MTTGNLSDREIESYRRDGFLFPVRVSDPESVTRWRSELEDLERSHGKLHYLPKAHLVLPLANRLARHPGVLDAVESLLGPDILLWDSTFIIKEPGDGKKVSWHQDLTYWGLEPQDVVSVWLALSPATVASGCMRMISGTHDGPIVAHQDDRTVDNILSRGQTIAATVDERIAVDVVLSLPAKCPCTTGGSGTARVPMSPPIGGSVSTPSIWRPGFARWWETGIRRCSCAGRIALGISRPNGRRPASSCRKRSVVSRALRRAAAPI